MADVQGHAEGAMPGFIGSCSYSQRNLFGLNQKLTAALEAGQSDSTFRISHTDPWVRGDPHRTSRTISLQSAKTSGEHNISFSRFLDDLWVVSRI